MSEVVAQCDNFDFDVCHRFSPAADGATCLRCGHIDPCHTLLGKTGEMAVRLCFFRRDDKTVKTCHEKFANGGTLPAEPAVPAVMVRHHHTNPACPLSPRRSSETEKHWKTMLDIRPGLGAPLSPQLMRNDRLSSEGHQLADHERDDNCATLGCYPVPAMPEYPSYAERLKQQLESDAVEATVAREMRIWQETGELPGSSKLEPLTKDQVRDLLAMPSAPRTWDYPIRGDHPYHVPSIPHFDIAAMRVELYETIRRFEKDDDLRGFTLARVYVRLGEWARLTADVVRYRDENPPKMESGQVGSMWVDTLSAILPIFESAFMPEKMNGRRVICLLEYERERKLLGEYRWPTQMFAPETRLRILTD